MLKKQNSRLELEFFLSLVRSACTGVQEMVTSMLKNVPGGFSYISLIASLFTRYCKCILMVLSYVVAGKGQE